MTESPDTAAFTAEPTRAEEVVGPSRAEYVQQVLGTARATLARSRGNDEFRGRRVDAPDVPERSRGRPLAPRDRTQSPQTPDTSISTWEQEREVVFEAIRGLRELCETLSDQLAAIRWRQLGSVFDTPHAAFGALSRWAHEDRARIETAGHSRDDHEQEPPAAANVG
jgi:hypothetical protein